MAATISRKLSNAFEGALAGGGDPATSPLYVFGPFLRLIVVAGVAQVTFGATVWLAVFTVVMVSAMYRQVMTWVTDGSGGSGLSEEEFGSWAVKINASITVIEYTLTFLVSMAALVTFIADRFPLLNETFLGLQYRVLLALGLSVVTGWVVNRGPKVSARAFGPATAAVLILLWVMVLVTIYKTGFHLPDFDLRAFSFAKAPAVAASGNTETASYIQVTFGGYARILALMTGIEIFANLIAAYDGTRAQRSRKAFGSLIIIMGTTAITMLIVGPAIFAHANPLNEHVSVFTQTMDYLLPPLISYIGTLIGVAVLLSACAAAAQGVQNLTLGLRYRHYVPAKLGQRNAHDVADLPVWIMTAVAGMCFLLFGTREDTYLALYAAGVFILLSMTGWAAAKRLLRELSGTFTRIKLASLAGTIVAALLTTFATFIIFAERFFEGAWSYCLLVPVFYAIFSVYRNRLGAPSSVEDRLGLAISGQGYMSLSAYTHKEAAFTRILVPLNGKAVSEQALPIARSLAHVYDAQIELLTVADPEKESTDYLATITNFLTADGVTAGHTICNGDVATTIDQHAEAIHADMIIMVTGANSTIGKLFSKGLACEVIRKSLTPTLLIRTTDHWRGRYSGFTRILVVLDGSEAAEEILPYIRVFAHRFQSQILLLSVPEGSESEEYATTIQAYLNSVAATLQNEGIEVTVSFTGSGPARTILAVAKEDSADLIMMTSHGRGGLARATIHLGSVTERVVQETACPVFVVPLTRKQP